MLFKDALDLHPKVRKWGGGGDKQTAKVQNVGHCTF